MFENKIYFIYIFLWKYSFLICVVLITVHEKYSQNDVRFSNAAHWIVITMTNLAEENLERNTKKNLDRGQDGRIKTRRVLGKD